MNLTQRLLLSPGEAASMLGVPESGLKSILPHLHLGSRTLRYPVDGVREAWPRFRPGENFDVELDWVTRPPAPIEPQQPIRQRGRYKLPDFPVTGRIYFVEGGELIKIGFAKSPLKRLESLRTGSAFELKLLASMPGSHKLERHLHARFAELRHRGEWFRSDPKLLRFIKEVARWKH